MISPLVSILISTYNHEEFIEETLHNAVEHDYANLEIIVTDDASTDRTPAIIQSFARKYPNKIIPLLHKENAGISANHAKGLRKCTGKYVVLQDGDDILLPQKITTQVAMMEKHTEFAITYHDVDTFKSSTGETLFLWSKRIGTRTGDVRTLVRYGPFMCLIGIMIRRKWIPEYGYDVRLRNVGDWYLLIEVLHQSHGRIGYINKVLARYRRHTSNVTSHFEKKLTDSFLTLALVESRWPELVKEVRIRRSELYSMMAIYNWQTSHKRQAMKLLLESMQLSFPNPFPWWRLGWRELRYLLRNRGSDYMLKVLFSKKGDSQ